MKKYEVDLVHFDGCPHVEKARANLRAVLPGGSWKERNLSEADTPDRFRRYGSPTVLVDGRDVTGAGESTNAMACRADGAPSREAIRKAIDG